MAVTAKGKVVKMTTSADSITDRLIVQAIAILSTSTSNPGTVTLTDGNGNELLSGYQVVAGGGFSCAFPCGLTIDGAIASTVTNAVVFLYLM